MPPKGHAILSASSADRWLHCPPSARLNASLEESTSSDHAAEGTEAHALCEFRLKEALGFPADDPAGDIRFYSEEMEDCAAGYAGYIMEQLAATKETCPDPEILIEQHVDFSRWVPHGFGTADCILIADGTLKIIDYKHGRGIEVSAIENPQMMCYALGALELFDALYDIETVSMTIFQPRRDNISTYEITKAELYRWADEVLHPTAELAYAGEGEFRCGSWCVFCKAKVHCRARADANLDLAKHEFKLPPMLKDEEIENLLGSLDSLLDWAADLKEYALRKALGGKVWHGWKVVEGRSIRRYTDEAAAAEAVANAGFDPYEKKILGITAMQKHLGKSRFEELLSGFIEKPAGKPTLVPESDKRPAINNAKHDFMEEM